jgi:hypothetical protein
MAKLFAILTIGRLAKPKKSGVTVQTYCLQYAYTAQYLGNKDKQQES